MTFYRMSCDVIGISWDFIGKSWDFIGISWESSLENQ